MKPISMGRFIGAARDGRKSDNREGDVMRRRDWLAGAARLCGAMAAAPMVAWPILARADNLASPVGLWRTIDDQTNKPRALVQVFRRNGLLYGRVMAVLDRKYTDALCQDCAGDRRNQPVLGLEIIRDMRPDGAEWDGGTILNPQTGDVYHCRMHLGPDGETLVVRGFIGFALIGRSQTWQRVPEN
jgi:uncharacterized protein (DUF2147 family)